LRSVYDGILIGSGTLLADDPSLNCRIDGGRNPTPIILDTHGRCPSSAKVLGAGVRPILCVGADRKDSINLPVDLLIGEKNEGGCLKIRPLLEQLYERGMYTILVEGGGRVMRSFIREGCVDILELYLGSTFLGGGVPWGSGCDFLLSEAPSLQLRSMTSLENDVHLSYFWGT
jgi:riboflavin-specific deaminase-like protein